MLIAEKYQVCTQVVYEIARVFRDQKGINYKVKINPEQYPDVVAAYEELRSAGKMAALFGAQKLNILRLAKAVV